MLTHDGSRGGKGSRGGGRTEGCSLENSAEFRDKDGMKRTLYSVLGP